MSEWLCDESKMYGKLWCAGIRSDSINESSASGILFRCNVHSVEEALACAALVCLRCCACVFWVIRMGGMRCLRPSLHSMLDCIAASAVCARDTHTHAFNAVCACIRGRGKGVFSQHNASQRSLTAVKIFSVLPAFVCAIHESHVSLNPKRTTRTSDERKRKT